MSEIQIPFSEEMQGRTWQNMKFCTSRNKRYGGVGDHFKMLLCEKDGDLPPIYTYHVIIAVEQLTLFDVAINLYWAEGFHGPKDFKRTWIKLHPNKEYNEEQKVWVHWYRDASLEELEFLESQSEQERDKDPSGSENGGI